MTIFSFRPEWRCHSDVMYFDFVTPRALAICAIGKTHAALSSFTRNCDCDSVIRYLERIPLGFPDPDRCSVFAAADWHSESCSDTP